MMNDTHIIIGAAWCIIGYIAGALAMVCLFWRRLSRPSAEEWRQREQALDDAYEQIRHLYAQNAALARRLAEQHGKPAVAAGMDWQLSKAWARAEHGERVP